MDSSTNVSIINALNNIILDKKNLVKDNVFTDITKLNSSIKTQLELLNFLDIKSSKQMKFVLKEVATHLTSDNLDTLNNLGKLNKNSELLLINSLNDDLTKIISDCKSFKILFNAQLETLKLKDIRNYQELFNKELLLINNLLDLLKTDGELEKTFNNNLRVAKTIFYSKFWSNALSKLAGVFAKSAWKIKVEGKENILLTGSVMFASRHYNGDYDGGVLLSSIKRRVFILTGMDWIQSRMDRLIVPLTYKLMGAIPVNRLNSPFITRFPNATTLSAMRKLILLLQSREAILIFPEAWPNLDKHYTPKKIENEFLPLQEGFIFCLEEAQKVPREIPVIPVGLIYDNATKIVTVSFGKPIYYDLTSKNRKLDSHADEIRKSFNDVVTSEIKRLSGL